MRNHLRSIGLGVLGCCLIAACARETAVLKIYEDPDMSSKTYNRLLIVDIASDHSVQKEFENHIAQRLRQEQIEAVPSHSMLDTSDGVTLNQVNAVGDQIEADGILVVHITSLDTTTEVTEGRETLKSTCRYGEPYDYFLYDHDFIKEADAVKVAHTVAVVSSLYDGESKQRVWAIQSTCFDKATITDALAEEANAIAEQLKFDELIG